MKYFSNLILSEREKLTIDELLTLTGEEIYNKYGFKRYEVISNSVTFLNGYKMEINLYLGEIRDKPYTEAILFDKEGKELVYSEMEDEYFIEYFIDWIFDNIDGDSYIVRAKK